MPVGVPFINLPTGNSTLFPTFCHINNVGALIMIEFNRSFKVDVLQNFKLYSHYMSKLSGQQSATVLHNW